VGVLAGLTLESLTVDIEEFRDGRILLGFPDAGSRQHGVVAVAPHADRGAPDG